MARISSVGLVFAMVVLCAGCGGGREVDAPSLGADAGAPADAGAAPPDAGPLPSPDTAAPKAVHEQQFAQDRSMEAHLGDTVVLNLEASGTHRGDLGGEGSDVVPLHYHTDVRHTLCFSDDENDPHTAVIRDAAGAGVVSIAVGECRTALIKAGHYTMTVTHARAGQAAEQEIVFIRPGERKPAPPPDPATGGEALALGDAACNTGCPVARSTTYGTLALAIGEVAVVTQACPPGIGDTLSVSAAPCSQTGKAMTGMVLGPSTQVVVFSGANLGGQQVLKRNDSVNNQQVLCFNDAELGRTGAGGSFIASGTSVLSASTCALAGAGTWCHNFVTGGNGQPDLCPNPPPSDASILPLAGEVTVLGTVDSGYTLSPPSQCCTPAYRFKGYCDDLSLIGFANSIGGVLLGDANTEVILFSDPYYGGRSTAINSAVNAGMYPGGWYYLLPPSSSTINAGAGSVTSLTVRTLAARDAITLITTKWCTRCNLANVDFSHQVLNYAHMEGSDLTQADLTKTQLANAYLGPFSGVSTVLAGVKATYVNLAGADLSKAVITATASGMPQANFSNAFMKDTVLAGANARSVIFTNAQFIDSGAGKVSFAGAQLDHAKFGGAILNGVDFTNATLGDTGFDNAVILKSRFKGIVNNGTTAANQVSFGGAVLYGTDFTSSSFDHADFTNALFSFAPGSYRLKAIDSFNPSVNNYVTVSTDVAYGASFPDKMPLTTTGQTVCPDGQSGPCTGAGGESPASCPNDCQGAPACLSDWDCGQASWSGKSGRFICNGNGTCVPCPDAVNCGDKVCDWIGGETSASCPGDCPAATTKPCMHASQCVARQWTLGAQQGHWECQAAGATTQCVAVADVAQTCGDNRCDMNGRWLPVNPPLYTGTNDLGGWTRPTAGVCK